MQVYHGPREGAETDSVPVTRPVVRDEEPATATDDQPKPYEEGNLDDHDADGDAEMGMVREEESEEEIGVLHEDIEDEVSNILLAQMGQSSRSYRRDFRKASRHLVSEIYSPPRITQEIKRGRYRNLAPGFAFDLTIVDPDDGEPWDFCSQSKRDKARRLIREQRPILLIGSPMCTQFSTWQ